MTLFRKLAAAIIFCGLITLSVQAKTMNQWHSMFNLNNTNKGGTYVEMKGDATVSLYLQSGAPAGVEFGYIVFNEKNGNKGGTATDAYGSLTFNDQGYATIGGFSDGDTIAFWTRDVNGNVTYSANISGGEGSYDKSFFDRVKQNEVYVPNYDHKINQLTMTSNNNTFSFSVVLNEGNGGSSAPSGQPLPGLLLTAGCGLAAAAATYRKKYRKTTHG